MTFRTLRILPLLIIAALLPLTAFAQEKWCTSPEYPTHYFRQPLDLPVSLSGTFAEIRPNHFHGGVDFRTGGKTGQPVHAAAEGYVSRIAISPWGGGKVLYITHPNGYRTVYMHLDAFCGAAGRFVADYQRQHQVYAMDVDLPADSIRVAKGEVVAYSGNTGASGGPHLHYEVRYAENDQPINPLYFGVNFTDNVNPTIRGIKVYPRDGQPYALKGDTIASSGPFYLGIYATDLSELGSGKNGAEAIELYVDGELFFRYCVPTFLYETTRGINALIDYPEYCRSGQYYIVSRVLPGNPNPFPTAYRDSGWLSFPDSGVVHQLRYRVLDLKGNAAEKTFYVKSLDFGPEAERPSSIAHRGVAVAYRLPFSYSVPGFSVEIPAGSLYDNDYLVYSTANVANAYSKGHALSLSVNGLPPHNAITLTLPVPRQKAIPAIEKLVVVCQSGSKRTALPTHYDAANDCLVATSKTWGTFAVAADTTAPTVKPGNFTPGKAFQGKQIKVRLSDNLAGVHAYHCYVNDEWVLAEYDGKTTALYIDAGVLAKGRNTLRVEAADGCGNQRTETYTLLR